ncbi:hypothetical protein ACER0C_003136 [Sarotherodon galilaeus]
MEPNHSKQHHKKRAIHEDSQQQHQAVHHPSKKAVLADWGMANIRDTAVGPTAGTYLYMAPECIVMFGEALFQTDMRSLGATYLEILMSYAPWVVKTQSELATLMATKTPPHALHISVTHSVLGGLVNYDPY